MGKSELVELLANTTPQGGAHAQRDLERLQIYCLLSRALKTKVKSSALVECQCARA